MCFLVVDSMLKDRTDQEQPLAKQGPLNENGPYVFGLHLVIVKCHVQDILEKGPWSMYALKRHFTWQLARRQLERAAMQRT